MALDPTKDTTTAPALTQAEIDTLYPSHTGAATLWKLSRPGKILLQGVHQVEGPQLSADGLTELVPSQTFYAPAAFASQYAAGLVIAGP